MSTLLVLDGTCPAECGLEVGGSGAATALSRLLAGSGATAAFLRAQRSVTLSDGRGGVAVAVLGAVVEQAVRAGPPPAPAPPPARLPPLSPVALHVPRASSPPPPSRPRRSSSSAPAVAEHAHILRSATPLSAPPRGRFHGRWLSPGASLDASGCVVLPPLAPGTAGCLLFDSADDAATTTAAPRPVLVSDNAAVVAEVAQAGARLGNVGDTPARAALEAAVVAVGAALRPRAPREALAAGCAHALKCGWEATAEVLATALVRPMTSERGTRNASLSSPRGPLPPPPAPNGFSLLHVAAATGD